MCELYNNGGIARVLGRPNILDQHAGKEDFLHRTAGIYTFEEYIARGHTGWNLSSKSDIAPPLGHKPNLTLNIGITVYPFWVQTSAAIAGVSAQFGILAWACIARYRLVWTRGGIQDRYAVPALVLGSTFLSFGVFMCALFIELTTKEVTYSRSSDTTTRSRVYWVQPGTQFIGDQAFDSFVFSHPQSRFTTHIASWKPRTKPQTLRVFIAVGTTATGFVLQILGLRACHSSVAVAQLGLVLLMSIIRSWLKSSRLDQNDVYPKSSSEVHQGCELDWLALSLGHLDSTTRTRSWEVCNSRYHPPTQSLKARLEDIGIFQTSLKNENFCMVSGFGVDLSVIGSVYTRDWTVPSSINEWRFQHLLVHGKEAVGRTVMDGVGAVLLQRARLGLLTDDWGDQLVKSRESARSLRVALESTMNILFAGKSVLKSDWDSSFRLYCAVPWRITESVGHPDAQGQAAKPYYISFLRRVNIEETSFSAWSIDDFTHRGHIRAADSCELEAMLGLWVLSLGDRRQGRTLHRRILCSTSKDCESHQVSMLRAWGLLVSSSHLFSPITFGSHNIPTDLAPDSEQLYSTIKAPSLYIVCAQEIFSIVFASLLHIVRDIGGTTTHNGSSMTNSSMVQIQNAFTDSGLGSAHDALACIIPALMIQGKLPKAPSS